MKFQSRKLVKQKLKFNSKLKMNFASHLLVDSDVIFDEVFDLVATALPLDSSQESEKWSKLLTLKYTKRHFFSN